MPAFMKLGDIKADVVEAAAHDAAMAPIRETDAIKGEPGDPSATRAATGVNDYALITDFNISNSAAPAPRVPTSYTDSGFDRGHMSQPAVDGLAAEDGPGVPAVFDAFLTLDGVDGESAERVALDHGTTVLAWARVDGVSPAPGEIHIESFSWGMSQTGAHGSAAGGGGAQLKVFDGRSGVDDDVIVDGRIITGENPAAMAEAEWKYVTVRPPAAPEEVAPDLVGPFDDLSDMTTNVFEAGGPYSTGYVKVSGDGF
ncbi:MAG: hypothetical protein ACK528_00555 [Alphaproteobacteria bacterium]